MKTYKIIGLFLSMVGVASAEQSLNVEVGARDDMQLFLGVSTKEIHSSMCGMEVTEYSVKTADFTLIGASANSRLELKFGYNPNAMCLTAFGPHRGSLEIAYGTSLPALAGTYDLVINGESYGTLTVNENSISLFNPEAVTQE